MELQRQCNLFIVGAMKAGTTSFNEMLKTHPSVYFSPIKEPHYFVDTLPKRLYEPSRFFNLEKYFKTDFPKTLHITKIEKAEHYAKIFSLAEENHIYRAEASTGYFHAPESANRIYEYNPEAKIIILLREPKKRAFSHYKMDLGLGRTIKSFEDEIQNDLTSFKNGKLSNWSYLGMSLYHENIGRYIDIFGKNVLILFFEDLVKNKDVSLEKVFQFLNIEKMNLEIPRSNTSSNLRFQKILFFLKQIGLKDWFSFLVPQSVRQSIFKRINKNKQLPMQLKKETLDALDEIFDKDRKSYLKLFV